MSRWVRIKFARLAYLLEQAPAGLRWSWHVKLTGKKKRLQVQNPHGAIWDFQMGHGTWLRKVEPPPQKPNANPTLTQTGIGLTQR